MHIVAFSFDWCILLFELVLLYDTMLDCKTLHPQVLGDFITKNYVIFAPDNPCSLSPYFNFSFTGSCWICVLSNIHIRGCFKNNCLWLSISPGSLPSEWMEHFRFCNCSSRVSKQFLLFIFKIKMLWYTASKMENSEQKVYSSCVNWVLSLWPCQKNMSWTVSCYPGRTHTSQYNVYCIKFF